MLSKFQSFFYSGFLEIWPLKKDLNAWANLKIKLIIKFGVHFKAICLKKIKRTTIFLKNTNCFLKKDRVSVISEQTVASAPKPNFHNYSPGNAGLRSAGLLQVQHLWPLRKLCSISCYLDFCYEHQICTAMMLSGTMRFLCYQSLCFFSRLVIKRYDL